MDDPNINAAFVREETQTLKPKIDMVRYKGETQTGQPSITMLFARSDGMIIGGVRNHEGQFGENPVDVARRSFIDHESAIAWVKGQCREYLGREDFSVRDGEMQVVIPRGPMPRVRM